MLDFEKNIMALLEHPSSTIDINEVNLVEGNWYMAYSSGAGAFFAKWCGLLGWQTVAGNYLSATRIFTTRLPNLLLSENLERTVAVIVRGNRKISYVLVEGFFSKNNSNSYVDSDGIKLSQKIKEKQCVNFRDEFPAPWVAQGAQVVTIYRG